MSFRKSLAALALAVAVASPALADADATISAVSGDVLVYARGTEQPARVGMALHRGDRVGSLGGGSFSLRFAGGGQMRCSEWCLAVVLSRNSVQSQQRETAADTRLECNGGGGCTQLRSALAQLAGRGSGAKGNAGNKARAQGATHLKVAASASSKRELQRDLDRIKGTGSAKNAKGSTKAKAKPAKGKKSKNARSQEG